MGNNLNKAVDKWGLNSRKFPRKSKKEKDGPAYPTYPPAEAHLYDTVADTPVYSVVSKKNKKREEVHYADVEVLQSHSSPARGSQRPSPAINNTTEYATIDFQAQPPSATATTQGRSRKANTSSKPADILIPPGELQRPVPKAALRKGSSKRTVVV